MNRFNFYYNLYQIELQRKNELNNALTLPVGLVSVIVIALYQLLANFKYEVNNFFVNALFISVISIATLFLIITIGYLISSYVKLKGNYDYYFIPYADELEEYYRELNKYYRKEINDKYETFIIKKLVICITHNMKLNELKTYYLWKAKLFLIYTLCITFVTLIPFLINYFLN